MKRYEGSTKKQSIQQSSLRENRTGKTKEMRRKEEELAKSLCRQMKLLTPDVDRKERGLQELEQSIAQKRIRSTPSWYELMRIELQYISPVFWILQGVLVMVLIFLLERTSVAKGELKEYLQWISALAAWMGVLTCSDLGRHFSRGMAELEQCCYFNLPQIWTIRMILSGTVDMLILLSGSVRISEKTFVPFVQVCLYILVPFVLSNAACLLLITAFRSVRGGYGQLVTAFLAGSIAAAFAMVPSDFYANTFVWRWIVVLLAGTLIYFWQLRLVYSKIRRGEALCWT